MTKLNILYWGFQNLLINFEVFAKKIEARFHTVTQLKYTHQVRVNEASLKPNILYWGLHIFHKKWGLEVLHNTSYVGDGVHSWNTIIPTIFEVNEVSLKGNMP